MLIVIFVTGRIVFVAYCLLNASDLIEYMILYTHAYKLIICCARKEMCLY